MRITGFGRVVNEPCDCTGTFTAQVEFPVFNNTGTNRYCFIVHFCPVTLPNGTVFDPGDVLIASVVPPGNTTLAATIPNYPCGAGTLCFGKFIEERRTRCPTSPAGCCTILSWEPNAPQGGADCPLNVDFVPAKCRLQQVCIVGRGSTTLDCDPSDSDIDTVCTVPCGGDTQVRLCTTGGPAPYTFTLSVPGQPNQVRVSSNLCETFTVQDITTTTVITGTVTDSGSPPCSDSAQVTLNVTTVTPVIRVSGNTGCTLGNLTFSASVPGFTDCTFNWFIDNVAAGSGSTLDYPADPDTACHTVRVEASCGGGGCTGTASTTVSQCVQTTLGCT